MDELDRSRQRLEPAPNHLLVDLVQPGLVALDVELDAPALRGPAEVAVFSHADEGLEVVGGHLMALFGEERDRGLGEKWFGDRQHPVEVENHFSKLGGFHARAIVFGLDGVVVGTTTAMVAVVAPGSGGGSLAARE